ncbi:hypothetical protein [Falsiroseomonas selenitidurans]|uniref:Uncharacterized protein n=1 Tax=Falsiroseomonas selenitidurans TaxID=2716335 RepID=A0ABX1E5E0_9PROT|nr:hypothetical protein [Falsiroseomonas selenitidurans]NKC32419.1 hypothetical protein [Falsiroseomonas selenitidurans]
MAARLHTPIRIAPAIPSTSLSRRLPGWPRRRLALRKTPGGIAQDAARSGKALAYGVAALALAAGVWAPPAQAQYRQEPAGRIGSGDVIRIFENGRFHRCSAAFFDSNRNMLRIAFTAQREYGLSIPQVVVQRGQPLRISVNSTGSGNHVANAQGNQGGRAWRALDLQTVERMMDFRGPLMVQAASTRYHWNLGTSVRNVLVAIENCTNRAVGWR